MKKIHLVIAFILMGTFAFGQQAISTSIKEALDVLSATDLSEGSPGLAVGIVQNGDIIYEFYGGSADLKKDISIGKDTRFNIASNGKQFTALFTLELIEDQRLKLQDDIRTYLPKLYPTVQHPITIAHLLNHTSGIRDVYDLWGLQGYVWWKKTFDNEAVLQLLERQESLSFVSGTEYMYSNSNYILLTQIIAKVVGQDFATHARQRFAEMGMPNTAFEDNYKDIPKMAEPYFNFDKWFGYKWTTNVHGDGALFTTLVDQLGYEQLVQAQASVIQKAQQTIPNSAFPNYGYGLEFGELYGIPYQFHEGATGAWKASMLRLPSEQLSVVVMTNSGKCWPPTLSRDLAKVILGAKAASQSFLTQPEKVGKAIPVKDLLGIYTNSRGFYFQFVEREDQLFLERFGRSAVELELEEGNIYHQKFDPAFKQVFTYDEQGNLAVSAYYTSHAPYTLKKIKADWSEFDPALVEGEFYSPELDRSYKLEYTGAKNYKIKTKNGKLEGRLLSPDLLYVGSYTAALQRDGKGKVQALSISGDRLRDLVYKRQ